MTFNEVSRIYWTYYISLERQLVDTSRYVEFDYINNRKAYSMEFLKLFQAVCSEIDVVGKVLASELDKSYRPSKETGINEWWYIVSNSDNTLESKACNLLGNYELQPWKDFVVIRNDKLRAKKYILDDKYSPKAKTPEWWKDYNSVKHDRTGRFEMHSTNYAKANLKNLFLAFSALFILEVKLMESIYDPKIDRPISTDLESKLFLNDVSFYTCLLSVRR